MFLPDDAYIFQVVKGICRLADIILVDLVRTEWLPPILAQLLFIWGATTRCVATKIHATCRIFSEQTFY